MKPVFLLLLLALLVPSASADADRAAYIRQLRAVERVVSEGSRAPASESRQAAARAVELLDQIERAGPVETPAGQVRPYLVPVRDMLSKAPPELGRASLALQGLIQELENPRAAEDSTARAALDDVYGDPRLAPNRLLTWQERLGAAVLDFLRRIFEGLSFGGAGARTLSAAQVAVLAGSLALLAVVALFIIRSVRRSGTLEPADGGWRPGQPETSSSLFQLAERCAREGDYRQAVRASFVGLLLHLHERGRLRYDRSLTNREHLSRIGRGTPLAAALSPAVRVFDDVWYGSRQITPQEYAEYAELTAAVRAADP